MLDDALGAVGDVGGDDVVGLVGGVAEEVALEDGVRVGQTAEQTVVGIHHGFQLTVVGELPGADVNHRMVFPDLRAAVEAPDFSPGVFKVNM